MLARGRLSDPSTPSQGSGYAGQALGLRTYLRSTIRSVSLNSADSRPAGAVTRVVKVIDVGSSLRIVVGADRSLLERLADPDRDVAKAASRDLGPLLAAAVLTASGVALSALPVAVVNAGQLLIGVGLGTRFTPEFFRAAPRFLGAVALITLLYLLAAAVFGAVLAAGSGLHWSTAIVATTPGGIGEMALTAQ